MQALPLRPLPEKGRTCFVTLNFSGHVLRSHSLWAAIHNADSFQGSTEQWLGALVQIQVDLDLNPDPNIYWWHDLRKFT